MGYPRSPLSAGCSLEEEKEDRQGGQAGRGGVCFTGSQSQSAFLSSSGEERPSAAQVSCQSPSEPDLSLGAGDMDQSTERLLSTQKDLSLSPSPHGHDGCRSLHP